MAHDNNTMNKETLGKLGAWALALTSLVMFGWLVWSCSSAVLSALEILQTSQVMEVRSGEPQIIRIESGEPQKVDVQVKAFGDQELGHGGPLETIAYPAAIGTAASPSTLTSVYNGASTTVQNISGLPNIVIAGTYLPKSYGSNILIQLERSLDDGATFFPYSTLTPDTTSTVINTTGASSTAGTPFVLPADVGEVLYTTVSGTAITFSWDLTLAAQWLRVKVKENTTSTFGTLNLQTYFTSN